MFRIRILPIVFFLFTTMPLWAQDVVKVDLRREKLEMGDDPFLETPFYIVRVVDTRSDKTNIGIVQRGVTKTKIPVVLQNGAAEQVQEFFNSNLPAKQGYLPVIIRLNQLSVTEKDGVDLQKATAAVVIDFVVKQKDSLYLVLQTSALIRKSGANVSTVHATTLAAALSECIIKFAKSSWKEMLPLAQSITEEQLVAPVVFEKSLLDLPILQVTAPEQGLYYSFEDFCNNKPDNTQPIGMEREPRRGVDWEGADKVTPYLIKENGKHKILRRIWGFSDGNQIYIYYDKDYFPLRQQGSAFFFDGYEPERPVYVPTGGGISGVLVGTGTSILIQASVPRKKETYQLDIMTGKVGYWKANKYQSRTVSHATSGAVAKVLIYYKKGKDSDEKPVTIQLRNASDVVPLTLSVDSYEEINWEDLLSELNVCVEGQQNPCYSFLPDVTKINYLEYVPSAIDTSESLIRPVKEQEAVFYLKKIKTAQEKAQKRQTADK
ncbi:hypothetical protein QNI22_29460 [Cytophagaceae bacterium BD1B2-1]|uniref:Uncharacterized protein n=2 Tax=Xanthocytophaga agilis TaxID=3048010 RepID=A0AAE3UIS9_9BACT|nr:hypothetical protein [Xanthocytophaga agilis]